MNESERSGSQFDLVVGRGFNDDAVRMGAERSDDRTPTSAACVVLRAARGEEPAAGSGVVLATSGEPDVVAALLHGPWTVDDEVVQLDAADASAGEVLWVVTRRRVPEASGRILVVDDEEAVRDFYFDALTGAGHSVVVAGTARDALALLDDQAFEVVLLDVRLPDANGFELCRQVMGRPGGHQSRILLMSADPMLADSERVLTAGADGFLVNPIRAEMLELAVRNALDRLLRTGGIPYLPGRTGDADIRLRFFGTPAVSIDGGRWYPLRQGRGCDILATLGAACPASISPDRLARFVWLDSSDISPNAVYTAVSRLRSTLASIGAGNLVTSDTFGYGLNVEPNQIDLIAFETASKEVFRDPDRATAHAIRSVLDRWAGRPFAGTGNTLLGRWSSRLAEIRSRLMELLALNSLCGGDPGATEATCSALLDDEPWREAIWSLRIVALHRCGRSNDALQVRAQALRRLREELGLDPGSGLAGLELMILTHDPLLHDDAWIRALMRGQQPPVRAAPPG